MKLPILKTTSVYHLGSMNPDNRAQRFADSYEGHCLSVSVCPSAWKRIAKLGGSNLFEIQKENAQFLDMHRVQKNKKLCTSISQWGLAKGFIESKTLWRSWNYDDESEEWFFSLHASREEAENELYDEVEECEGPNGDPIESVESTVGTKLLSDRVKHADLSDKDAFDYLVMVWTEDTQVVLDGVWWQETYAPESYSAPRGGIFPSKLSTFNIIPSDICKIEDDENEECFVREMKNY